ncbi:MAG: hypothetical protein ACRC91_04740 [Aeromonas sp.]
MNWLTMYLDVFSSMPITTTMASVSIVFIVGVLVLSVVFDLIKHLQDYWDRYETPNDNAFNTLFGKTFQAIFGWDCRQWRALSGHWVGVLSYKSVDGLGGLSTSPYDVKKTYYLYRKTGDGKYHQVNARPVRYIAHDTCGFDNFEELSHLPMRYSITEAWLLSTGALVLGTVVAFLLDILLFSFFLQTVVVASVVALILVVLKGGRAITDLKKSIAKLNGNKEAT